LFFHSMFKELSVLGIIKKKAQKARSIISKTNRKAGKPPKVNSGWKEIASDTKEPAAIHKETASGWDLITKGWKKTPQPSRKTRTPIKASPSLGTKTPATDTSPIPSSATQTVVKPESAKTSSTIKTKTAQPTAIGRPTPVSKKSAPSQPAATPKTSLKPQKRPAPKSKPSPHPKVKPSLAKLKPRLRKRKIPAVADEVTNVAREISDGWEELAAGWGQAPDGWNVVAPHHDDPDDDIELHFRKNVHTLSNILKEMADELFMAIQQRDDQILFVRTELQKYKNKAKRLELTVQQQWDEEVLRVRDKEIAKARNEMKIYKAKAERLEKTLSIQDEYTYERILIKYDHLVRDILVKRTLNNEQKMRHLMLIAHHLGIPHGEAIRVIRDKVNKIMAQVNRL